MPKALDDSLGLGEMLNFRVDFSTRTMFLIGEINDEMFGWFSATFSHLDKRGKKPITIRLTSPGGDADLGFAIFDIIRNAQNKVVVEVFGFAYSIAALILQGADLRSMSPSARLMIHDTTVVLGGGESSSVHIKQITSQAEVLKDLCESIYVEIANRTGQKLELIKKLGAQEKYLNAKEALNLKFVDKILQPKKK